MRPAASLVRGEDAFQRGLCWHLACLHQKSKSYLTSKVCVHLAIWLKIVFEELSSSQLHPPSWLWPWMLRSGQNVASQEQGWGVASSRRGTRWGGQGIPLSNESGPVGWNVLLGNTLNPDSIAKSVPSLILSSYNCWCCSDVRMLHFITHLAKTARFTLFTLLKIF